MVTLPSASTPQQSPAPPPEPLEPLELFGMGDIKIDDVELTSPLFGAHLALVPEVWCHPLKHPSLENPQRIRVSIPFSRLPPIHRQLPPVAPDPVVDQQRCLPLNPPWGFKILYENKCVENRGTPVRTTLTILEKSAYNIWLGETKGVDAMYRDVPQSTIRAAPEMASALVGVARIVAVLDYTNVEHVKAILGCSATAPWYAPGGNRNTGLIISHIVRLECPLPYQGKQGIHGLPSDVPSALELFRDEDNVQRLLDPADELMFAGLHRQHCAELKTTRNKTSTSDKRKRV